MSLNKVFLIGNLGRDPELREAGRSQVCEFSLATSERFKKDGEWEERTEWHRVVVWGKTAEACSDHLRKGSQVYVEGKIQTRKWDDKDGNERLSFEIIAANVQFLDGRSSGGHDDDDDEPRGPRRRQNYSPRGGRGRDDDDRGSRGRGEREQRDERPSRRSSGQNERPKSGTSFDDMEDDIPF